MANVFISGFGRFWQALFSDIMTPERGATPYHAGLLALGHGVLSGSIAFYFDIGLALATLIAGAYLVVKEVRDYQTNGDYIDSLLDALWVWLGFFGPPFWFLGFAVAYWRRMS